MFIGIEATSLHASEIKINVSVAATSSDSAHNWGAGILKSEEQENGKE